MPPNYPLVGCLKHSEHIISFILYLRLYFYIICVFTSVRPHSEEENRNRSIKNNKSTCILKSTRQLSLWVLVTYLSKISRTALSMATLFFFFFFGCTHGIRNFPGQEMNPNHSCDLCCSCCKAKS